VLSSLFKGVGTSIGVLPTKGGVEPSFSISLNLLLIGLIMRICVRR